MPFRHSIIVLCIVNALAFVVGPLHAQDCSAPPLYDLGGPSCSAARQNAQCACSECMVWDPAPGATWYEIRRCERSSADCTIVGDTRWRNRGTTPATLWCVPWDDPFPRVGTSYQYSIRACADGPSGPLCSFQLSTPVNYMAAPYMCIENGVEVSCATSTPPPSGFASDFDEDGFTDSADPDDDGDEILDGIDNCQFAINIGQRDTDRDGAGDVCDLEPVIPGPGSADGDGDGIGDAADNCPSVYDPPQDDTDKDRTGDACDNCPNAFNEAQSDTDGDGEGDACDLDDGTIHMTWGSRTRLDWPGDMGDTSWCVYRGDLAELRRSGTYTQNLGSYPLAGRFCNLAAPLLDDTAVPGPGTASFYLAGGRPGSYATELGIDSQGDVRPNTNPCP